MNHSDKPTKREIFSWCMFDFANSSYTTIVITAIYSAYFASAIAGGGTKGDHWWAVALSLSYLLVVLLSPLIGAVADHTASHKRFLRYSYLMCVVATAVLFLARPGNILFAVVLIVFSNFAFALSENLISSFLPHLADEKNIGKISGYGWSFGYIGGLLSLFICLVFLELTKQDGHFSGTAVRATCLITAGFFFLAGLPTMFWLRQRGKPQPIEGTSCLSIGFGRLWKTLKQIPRYREMFKFMFSFLFYASGIATVISFAAIYAQGELGFSQSELILLIAVVNITSAVGAFLFGFFQDKTGAKTTLIVTIGLWTVTIIWAYLVQSKAGFYGVANLAGIAIGASQSAGRALVGLFAPKDKEAEFYGFWGFFGKIASIIGIYSFGFLAAMTGSRRIAILSTAVFFLIGFVILIFVNESKGIAAAKEN